MLKQLKKPNRDGFTIIEVMIVLAIAGLILLIVFLAVPALQRNSRNTQMKNSAAAVLSAIGEFQGNNNGRLPTAVGPATATGDCPVTSAVAGSTTATARIQPGYTCGLGGAPAAGTTGAVNITLNVRCNGNVVGAATQRAYVALYNVEISGGTAPQCTES